MHIGKSYRFSEFLAWTRRRLYLLTVLALVPVMVYQLLGLKWIAIPWSIAVMLGTATSFIVGFKNAQTYNRTLEAQQVWSSLVGISRYWGLLSRDFSSTREDSASLVHRHLAWLTALRYQLRGPRVWESVTSRSNAEYLSRVYDVPETQAPLDPQLQKLLPAPEFTQLAASTNKALHLMTLQSAALEALLAEQRLTPAHYFEMQKTLKDLLDLQSRVERIKNFPYPRQYATINAIFVWSFATLLPFGLVREFDRLNDVVPGVLHGHMAWLAVPFSMLIAWMYVSLDQVGESTENPFEGGANDVPISQTCRSLEVELRGMLGERDLPPLLAPKNHIIL